MSPRLVNPLKTRVERRLDTAFASIPGWMYADPRISSFDRDVYGSIKLVLFGNVKEVELTLVEIADFLHKSDRHVKRSIQVLKTVGALKVRQNGRGANVYSDGQRIAPKAQTKPNPKCGRCAITCRRVNKAGICRTCWNAEKNKADLVAAMATVGANATDEQIAAAMHLKRITAKVKASLVALRREQKATA